MPEAVYLDNAATTPVDPRVVEAMRPYWEGEWGNPSSVYAIGRRSRRALDDARDRIAQVLNCRANEIVFTGCGSESDNLAIKGVAHGAVRATRLQARGHHDASSITPSCTPANGSRSISDSRSPTSTSTSYGRVDAGGGGRRGATRYRAGLDHVRQQRGRHGRADRRDCSSREGRSIRRPSCTPTRCRRVGCCRIDVQAMGVDLLALSGHKFYAPKGVGLLYVRRGTPLVHLLSGGGQERGVRAGTENVAYIVGMATALELAYTESAARVEHVSRLRDRLVAGVLEQVPGARLTGHPTERMPNSASFTIEGADGESILLNLDQEGIYASSGSACTSGTLEISHVLRALGLPDEQARGSLRLTTGTRTTDDDVDRLLDVLPGVVERVREVTPLSGDLAG